ncbi:hypothetical protein NDU88_006212 [Pleurodeles waltl]|uniref:Uncharacterized protein n=1 Tax=Pleurodeles waltl TaxID=8319 RepID=A0AAV7NPN8_PLEWA|nr:hypothetical protein NDU88_006212 [Pleurodeles waltl]
MRGRASADTGITSRLIYGDRIRIGSAAAHCWLTVFLLAHSTRALPLLHLTNDKIDIMKERRAVDQICETAASQLKMSTEDQSCILLYYVVEARSHCLRATRILECGDGRRKAVRDGDSRNVVVVSINTYFGNKKNLTV